MMKRSKKDVPPGVRIAREANMGHEAGDMTDESGRFISANRNPVLVPNTYREGLNAPVDTRTGKPLPRKK